MSGKIVSRHHYLLFILLIWAIAPCLVAIATCIFRMEYIENNTSNIFFQYIWTWDELDFHTQIFYFSGTALAYSVIYCLLFKKIPHMFREEPWHLFFLLVLVWAIIATIRSEDRLHQFLGIHYLDDGLISWLLYGAFYLGAYFLKDRREIAIRVFTIAANVCALLAIAQGMKFAPVIEIFPDIPSAIFHNINYFGYYLCMSLTCLFGLWIYERNIIYLFSIILQTYALLVDDSFGPYLGVLIAIPFIYVLFGLSGCRTYKHKKHKTGRKKTKAVKEATIKATDSDVSDSNAEVLEEVADIGTEANPANLEASIDTETATEKSVSVAKTRKSEKSENVQESKTKKWVIALIPAILFFGISLLYSSNLLPSNNDSNWADNFNKTAEDITTIISDSETAISNTAGSGRYKNWLGTLSLIVKKPIFGFGPEAFQTTYFSVLGNGRPHNEILQYAAFFGVPAAIFYLVGLFLLLKKRWSELKDLDPFILVAAGGVAGYFISGLFGITLFSTTPYYFMLLGFVAAGNKKEPVTSTDGETTRPSKILGVVRILLTIIFYGALTWAFFYLWIGDNRETQAEEVDITNMETATAVATNILTNNMLDEPRDFWLDIEQGILVPHTYDGIDNPPPAPYGQGTAREGRGTVRQRAINVGYSWVEDYRGKIISLHLDPYTYEVSASWTDSYTVAP